MAAVHVAEFSTLKLGVLTVVLILCLEVSVTNGITTCSEAANNTVIHCKGPAGSTENLPRVPHLNNVNRSIVYHKLTFDQNISVNAIQANAFRRIQVRQLILRGLKVSSLDEEAFNGLGYQLTDIALEGNAIQAIPNGTFQVLNHVRQLSSISLSANMITKLESDTFSNLTTVEWLYLSDNKLNELPEDLLRSMIGLRGLWLDGNKLTTISEKFFNGLSYLTWLHLNGNQLQTISPGTFQGLNLLERLFLHDNLLKSVPKELLAPLGPSLEYLDITSNQLSKLPSTDLQKLNKLKYLAMSGNRLQCDDCTLVNWLRQLPQTVHVAGATCYSTASGQEIQLVDDPECAPPTTTTTPTTTAGGGSLSIGVIAGAAVGGIVLLGGVVVGIIIFVCLRRGRRSGGGRETDFNDTGSGIEQTADSTRNLFYRIGSRRYLDKPLFKDNAKTVQATAAAKEAAGMRGGSEAAQKGVVLDGDGSPATGEEDVSVAAKPGLKVLMNTDVVAQGFTKIVTDC